MPIITKLPVDVDWDRELDALDESTDLVLVAAASRSASESRLLESSALATALRRWIRR